MKSKWQQRMSALAALICGLSVALAAYASHGLEAQSQHRLLMASVFAFTHGLSLIVLVRLSPARSNFLVCILMLWGICLFSGSLASAALWQTSTALAPIGGSALILSWCWLAVNFIRVERAQ